MISRTAVIVIALSSVGPMGAVSEEVTYYGDGDYREHHYGSHNEHLEEEAEYGHHREASQDAEGAADEYGEYGHSYGEGYHYGHEHYGYADHAYYASREGYLTHGSLLIDDLDAYNEFVGLDSLETAVVGFFPPGRSNGGGGGEGGEAEDEEEATFLDMARDYSHLLRFGHCRSAEVAAALGWSMDAATVVLVPAPQLAKVHPRAGQWLLFPGRRISREGLTTFLFLESAPLVDQHDWRSTERASVAEVPTLTVFGALHELHHAHAHTEDDTGGGGGEEEAEDAAAAAQGGGARRSPSRKKTSKAAAAAARAAAEAADTWTFDTLAAALLPVALEHEHSAHVLVADKRRHDWEMRPYQLNVPDTGRRVVGLGLHYDGSHYSRVVRLSQHKQEEDPEQAALTDLAAEVGDFLEDYFAGQLEPVRDQDQW